MGDVSGPVAGTSFTVAIGLGITGVCGVLKHYVTEHFKRKDREMDRMAEQKAEEQAAATKFARDAEVLRLETELAQARADLEDVGADMRALADAKTLAEQQRDRALANEIELRKQLTATRKGGPTGKNPDAPRNPDLGGLHHGAPGADVRRPDLRGSAGDTVRPRGRKEGG